MLRNPIWHSLCTRHAHLAIECGVARRYPPEVTPFVAVSESSQNATDDLEALVNPGERIGILGVIPTLAWTVAREIEIHQYVWLAGRTVQPGPETVDLGDEHIPAMRELTALVYPAYFRPGTAKLGPYIGLFEAGKLCAMAGIRMALDGYQEISAICTHPDHRGQGLAGILTRELVRRIVAQGDVPFLHTESDNPAKGMYEKLGFELGEVLPFRVLEKPAARGAAAR